MTTTHTYVILPVSQAAYDEIREKLRAAGHGDQFHTDSDGETIDMHGLAITCAKNSATAFGHLVSERKR